MTNIQKTRKINEYIVYEKLYIKNVQKKRNVSYHINLKSFIKITCQWVRKRLCKQLELFWMRIKAIWDVRVLDWLLSGLIDWSLCYPLIC